MPAVALSGQYIITSAFRKLGVIASSASPDGDDNQVGLDELNEIFEQWNLRKRKAFYEVQQSFAFTTSKTSYSIGISANSPDFVMSSGSERPVKLEWAQLVLTDQTPNVYLPAAIINVDLYWQISTPQLSSQFPLTIYYQPTMPNGTIYPYPASPTLTSYKLMLRWWAQFTTLAMSEITNTIQLPNGYKTALVWELAKRLYAQYPGRSNFDFIQQMARTTASDVESPNQPPPIVDSTDGINNKDNSSFDWRSRSFQ